jgi:putative N-acetyltransferase (TIGR04045 family)
MLSPISSADDPHEPYRSRWILAEPALQAWQLRAYYALRCEVFVREQHLFKDSDVDADDAHAFPLVALATCAGVPDEVVGVVRIYPASERGCWFGGRLAVTASYRRSREVGAALIRAAVGSARAFGAERFLATVQLENVRYFERHHFVAREPVLVSGQPHQLMEAELAAFAIPVFLGAAKREAA